jgi:hypothetical protein
MGQPLTAGHYFGQLGLLNRCAAHLETPSVTRGDEGGGGEGEEVKGRGRPASTRAHH